MKRNIFRILVLSVIVIFAIINMKTITGAAYEFSLKFGAIMSIFLLPFIYAAVACVVTYIIIQVFFTGDATPGLQIFRAAKRAFIYCLIPMLAISRIFTLSSGQYIPEVNNGWVNVGLLSIILLSVFLSCFLELRNRRSEA